MADISKIKLPDNTTYDLKGKILEVKLTNEDLNDVNTVGFYYAAGGNTVTNKPSGYNNFGLEVTHNASGSQYTQIIYNENGSHRRIKKADGTWTSWAEDKFTDENVKQAILEQTDTGWHKVIIGGTSLSETIDKVNIVNGLNYRPSSGTLSVDSADGVANTARTNIVKIGNNKTKATANHVEGRIDLYGENGGYSTLKYNSTSTAHKTHTLPDKDGTLATTDDAEKVKQTAKTDNADYRLLLSKSASDSEETDGVNKNTNLKYNPDTTILTSPKLNVTSTINASGTADNKPALMIGPVTGVHIEMDQNELMAKGSGTTTSTLHLNADGSNVTINNNSNSVILGNGMIDLRNGGSNTDFPLKVNLNRRSPSETPGEDIRPIVVYYQTKDLNGDTRGRTAYPFAVIGNNATNTNNTGVRLGSHNGTTIVGAGESSITFASAQSRYNDENLYLTADGRAHIYQGLSNESDSYKGHIILPYNDHHGAFDVEANEFVAAYQRNCIVGNDNAVSATARWYDAGSLYLNTSNTDFTSMFTVYNTYSSNDSSKEAAGLLFIHARVGSDKAYQYAYMKFIANSGFDVSHFRLAWRNTTNGTVFNLFTYIETRYIRRRFTEISQGLRYPSTDNPSNGNYRFYMYDGSTAYTNDQITNNWNGYIEAI